MEIRRLTNRAAMENTYFLINEEAILLVDPGSNTQDIFNTLNEINKPIAAILLTHTHYDHIMSLEAVREHFNHPPVYVSEKEASWLADPSMNLSGLDRHSDMDDIICEDAEEFFEYHKDYQLSGFNFYVVETPGHSIGGVSFVFPNEELVLTGDALFKDSIGRTDLPTGNLEQLLTSIREELFVLPNHYRIFPGHGFDSTISHEKTFNPFFH